MIARIKNLESNDLAFGIFCVLLATVGLSTKAILIKLIYESAPGIDAVSVLTLRFGAALPFFLALLYFHRPRQSVAPTGARELATLAFLGIAGFYLSAYLDYSALMYIPAGLERLILFLYPTFVVMISMVVRPGEVSTGTLGAMGVSYLGLFAVFLEQASSLDAQMTKGAMLVLAAAVTFAMYTVASAGRIRKYGSIRFTSLAMIAATVATTAHGLLEHGLQVFDQSAEVYGLIIPMALFSTVLPLLLVAEGIKRIGAANTSIISTSGPPLTLIMAYFILGETFGPLQLLGGAMIIGGVFLIARKK